MSATSLDGSRFVIDIASESYPASLRELPNAPEKLYVVGSVDALQPGLAVIGARKATPYGLSCSSHFSRIAAEKGVCIVSGGARGCDAEAHRSALAAHSPTVVFLGGGCDCVYPPEHRGLFQRIADAGGAVVSEHAWNVRPMPYAFRARNRLIAGLAEVVLIVEAGLPSGTFSTADEALAMGKEVLVVPGAITSTTSHGSNRLLYQGAIPVVDDESFEDVLFSTMGMLKRELVQDDTPKEAQSLLIDALRAQPMSSDELFQLALKLHGESDARSAMMTEIAQAEARGIIARYRDGRWGPRVQ